MVSRIKYYVIKSCNKLFLITQETKGLFTKPTNYQKVHILMKTNSLREKQTVKDSELLQEKTLTTLLCIWSQTVL
jgi:hypothetical protein